MMPEKIFSMLLLVKNKLRQPENLVKQKIDDCQANLEMSYCYQIRNVLS